MMKYMSKALLLCGFVLACMFCPANGQLPDAGCPPASEECAGELTNLWTSTFTITPQCFIFVTYAYRICADGSIQFYLKSIEPSTDCEGFTSMEVDGLSLSTLVEYVQLNIMQTMFARIGGTFWWPAPNCELEPGQTATTVQFYSANCWVWQRCTWDIEATPPVCDTDPQPAFPPPGGLKVDQWSWHNCGRTCCKRTYEICMRSGVVLNRNVMVIQSMTREKIGECSDQSSFQKPCQDGC